MTDFPELKTRNLVLREIADAEAAGLLSIHGDAEHMKWFGSDPLKDIEGAQRLIQTFATWREEPASGTRWGIQLRNTPGLIGTCGLFRWNRNWRTCVVGYEISPLHQGRGYMQEPLAAVISWGFREMHEPHRSTSASCQPGIACLARATRLCRGRTPSRSRLLGRVAP